MEILSYSEFSKLYENGVLESRDVFGRNKKSAIGVAAEKISQIDQYNHEDDEYVDMATELVNYAEDLFRRGVNASSMKKLFDKVEDVLVSNNVRTQKRFTQTVVNRIVEYIA